MTAERIQRVMDQGYGWAVVGGSEQYEELDFNDERDEEGE